MAIDNYTPALGARCVPISAARADAIRALVRTLSPADLARFERICALLCCVSRPLGDRAVQMLAAGPEPYSADDARDRLDAVINHLETSS